MDASAFDRLARSLVTLTSRRHAASALLAAGFGFALRSQPVAGACRVVGKPCRHPEQCCTAICKHRTCRCPDGRKACGGLCCSGTQRCRNGRCCTVTGAICPAQPTDCCSFKAGTGGCSGAHNHCCIFKGACTATTECCFANQACQGGVCCFLAGADCGAGERCCSGVCNSSGSCT
jgi:hypothetical protein